MRVSQFFGLDRFQPELDFVDVDVYGDCRVFVDPRALRLLRSTWGEECVSLLQSFFSQILSLIRAGRAAEARALLGVLREPNETHLGLSRGRARGRAVGREKAHDLGDALSRSEAAKSGLLEDLEDTILMVEGVDADIVSDMTTNIIRGPLIDYTREACAYYGIPISGDVPSGPLWDPGIKSWRSQYVGLPRTSQGRLLLVPKVIVRVRMDYDPNEYYRHYILEHLREVEMSANTELVRLLRDGRARVTKKDLVAKYGQGKAVIVRETRAHPQLLEQYRADKRKRLKAPLDHYELAATEGTPLPDWEKLLAAVFSTEPGQASFVGYERAIEGLLTALFYPSLTNPRVQRALHEGRKRVDITYSNVATGGFFHWLALHFAAANVFVECKNYGGDVGNPELDQLSGRFSPSRGQFGLLVCRSFGDKALFITRCRDTADDHRGFIVPLDDHDLAELVNERKASVAPPEFQLLRTRFDALVM